MIEYVSAKMHPGGPTTDLRRFMSVNGRTRELPPYHLDGAGGAMLVDGVFRAVIYANGRPQILGTFPTAEEAQSAYEDAARGESEKH